MSVKLKIVCGLLLLLGLMGWPMILVANATSSWVMFGYGCTVIVAFVAVLVKTRR